jgi:hypothetical protein
VSELCGLRWNNVHESAITTDERYCRGDWGAPKSDASNPTIPVNGEVIERIHRLKLLTIEVNAGRAKRRYKVAKSVQKGRPMRDNNILIHYLKPAGRAMRMP